MNSGRNFVVRGALLMLALGTSTLALAEVHVEVDRNVVQSNESFSLTLTADAGEQGEPDIEGLDKNFDVLGRSESSAMSIINGRRQSNRRWTYVLLPKATGDFVIGPLSVAGSSSQPIKISVREATKAPPGEADVFFEVSLDREKTYVQAQAIYTMKLYLGVAVRQSNLHELTTQGGEILIEALGKERRYDAQIGERLYQVIEQKFALWPQSSGTLTLDPARFSASLWTRGRISTPRVFTSTPLVLEVLPMVPPPAEHASASWLPAQSVALTATLDPADGQLRVGEPANVRLKLQALGLRASQLPEIEIGEQAALRVYPDKPDLVTRALPNTMMASREQNFALIAAGNGDYVLRTIELPWFDIDAGEWAVATLDFDVLHATGAIVSPSEQSSPAEQVAAVDDVQITTPSDAQTDDMRRQIKRWKIIAYSLLALWLVTLWAVWRADARRAKKRVIKKHSAPQVHRRASKALNAATRACKQNDAHAASAALLSWAALNWPNESITTLGQIAERGVEPLRDAIEDLNRHCYGPQEQPWQGHLLAAALNAQSRAGSTVKAGPDSVLPELLGSAK